MLTETDPCSCVACQSACTYKPGWFLPGEPEILAQGLGLTLQQLFDQFLAVDYVEPQEGEEHIFLLSPAVTKMEPGTVFPFDPRGECVFYVDEKCSVHEHGKPAECRRMDHDTDRTIGQRQHMEIGRAWAEHQEQIEELLGKKPEVAPFSLFTAISLMFGLEL